MTQNLLEEIAKQYRLPFPKIHERITRGVLSNNHTLNVEGTLYFLKQWRFTDLARVREITAVEKYFAKAGIPVILPLPTTPNGSLIIEHDGMFYSLYPFVPGKHIERELVDGDSLQSMAMMLGRIHLVSQSNPLQINERFKWWNRERIIEKMQGIQEVLEGITNKSTFDHQASEYLSRKLLLINSNTVQPGDLNLSLDTLIHGDYHESNLFFENDQVTHVFDFEKAEIAPRVFELIRCVELTFINGEYTSPNLDRAAQFISVYSRNYPISVAEIRQGVLLWFLKGIHSCWIEEEHYLKNNTRPDIFLENGLKSLRYETDHLTNIAEVLVSKL